MTGKTLAVMTQNEIYDLWRSNQQAARTAGREYYRQCVNAITGQIYATIDNDGRGSFDVVSVKP